ncbi:hypothetical protein HDU67_003985 [Dinochytrium kinnereticum]|nr:hypothetical protein HDU67_003985 [Dinochytrium kinnereticum]
MSSLSNSMENLNGRLGHLIPEQDEALAKFKEELAAEGLYNPEIHDDHLLLRFLRARKFQIPLAKKMWSESEAWRKEYGTDDLKDNFDFPEYPVVKKFYPRYYHKVDKIGRPLYVERFGVLDITQLFSVTSDERMLKNHVYEYEKLVHYRLPACSSRAGRHLEQSCVIMDLKGVSISMFPSVFGLVKQVSTIAQNYYPEMLGKMFIINAPYVFTGVWSVVKPLLDEVTVNKIYLLGSGYKERLLEFIDADCLPESLGGTCRCEGGCETADIGPWNDGSVEGYPKKEFERFEINYGSGDYERFSKNKKANGSNVKVCLTGVTRDVKMAIPKPKGRASPSPRKLPAAATMASPGSSVISVILIVIYLMAAAFVFWRHYELPTPKVDLVDVDGRPQFSEALARAHVKELAGNIGMRVVGTKGEDQARNYIVEKLEEYKAASAGNPFVPEFVVMKIYTNITNVVVRISCGEECNKNSLLINSHFDSQIVTPGACDDACSVAVMLEMARIVSLRREPMRNSLILLFNGAEESFQDASHAFVKTSPLVENVKAFLNLEAMGNHGKEVLFQSNSRGMVDAYKAAPYPHGSVVSNDIFLTGLVLSDTDFRQFVDHGDLHGLDMAIYQNSFIYHTMLDVVENVQVGLLQHMGENSVAIVEHLLGNITIENFTTGRDYIYYDFFGLFFVVYDWSSADAFHAALILTAFLLAFRTSFVGIFASDSRRQSMNDRLGLGGVGGFMPLLWTFASVGVSMIAMIVAPALQGALMQYGLGKPLTYFRGEMLAFLLFAPIALAALFGSQVLIRFIIPTHALDTPVNHERRTWSAVMLWNASFLLLTTILRLGSAYIFSFTTFSFCLGLLIDRLLTPMSVSAPNGSHFPIHRLAYAATYPLVAATAIHHMIMGLNLFVPLTGRIGATSPVDVILGGLVGVLCVLSFSSILAPLIARVSRRQLVKAWGFAGFISLLVILVFSVTLFPYDEAHPKRVFMQYMRNTTSGQRTVHVSHSDPPYLNPVLDSVSTDLEVPSRLQSVEENDQTWATIYPFSHFIVSHVYDVTETQLGGNARAAKAPLIVAEDVRWNEARGERSLTVKCFHPDHVWTVISFHADVISWSLDSTPTPGLHHHVIRHAGSYGTNIWNVSLTVRATSSTDRLKIHLTGVERDTFSLEPMEERKNGGVAQLGWLWGEGFESARVLKKVQDAVPGWVTGLYLAVVVEVSEV